MLRGELFAVDTARIFPLTAPVADGVKINVNVTLWLGESVVGNVSLSNEKAAPVMFTSEIVIALPPVLVSVSDKLELLLFCSLPNESVDGDATRVEPVLKLPGDTPWQLESSAIPAAIKTGSVKPRCSRKTCKGANSFS